MVDLSNETIENLFFEQIKNKTITEIEIQNERKQKEEENRLYK
jgi:hypothetical protein